MSIWMGPFFRCVSPKKKTKVKHRACLTEGCQRQNIRRNILELNLGFCPACGHAIGEVVEEKEGDAINRWDVAEKIKEVMMPRVCPQSGDHCWFPNRPGDYPHEFWMDELREGACEITSDALTADMLWLGGQFHQTIRVLREFYGEDNVRGVWGLFVGED